MVKNMENEVIPRFVRTFAIVTFDSESWIDADEDDSTLAGKGKSRVWMFSTENREKNKIPTSSEDFSLNVIIVNVCAGLVNYISVGLNISVSMCLCV